MIATLQPLLASHGAPPPNTYSPYTHFSVVRILGAMVQSGLRTRVVYRATIAWMADRDGRVRDLHELNLARLGARVIDAREEPWIGNHRAATLTLEGASLKDRFFPKD